MNEVRGFFSFWAVILKKLVHKSGTGCARVWDGLKITKKKNKKGKLQAFAEKYRTKQISKHSCYILASCYLSPESQGRGGGRGFGGGGTHGFPGPLRVREDQSSLSEFLKRGTTEN